MCEILETDPSESNTPRHPNLVCPKCFASLADRPAIGRCPECDEVYWPAAVKNSGIRPFVSNREPWLRNTHHVSLATLVACYSVGYLAPRLALVVLVPSISVAAVSGLILLHYRRSATAQLRDLNFRMCPGCRYVLAGLADSGACPECGDAYDVETLGLIWSRAYRVRSGINTPSKPSPQNPRTPPASPTPPPGASTN